MGTVYSSWSGTWYPPGAQTARKYRARLDYRTISETRTTVTYGATLYVNVNASLTTSFEGSLNLPGTGNIYEGSCSMDYGDSTTDKCISEKTITINKETSAKTVTISGKIKSTYANAGWGDWKTAKVDISIPAISHSISFDANGGINPPASQTKELGIDLVITSDVPTYTGYDFLGWATEPDAEEVEYYSGDTFTIDEDTTLYAVWHLSYVAPSINEFRAYRVAPDPDASGYDPDVLPNGTRCYVDFLFTEAVSGETEISGTFDEEEVTTVGETGDIRYMYSSNGNLPTYESGTVTIILNTTDYKGNTYSYEYSTFISTENYVWDAFKGTSGSEEYGSFAIGGAARDFGNQNRSSKGNFDIYMDMSIVLNDCTITDSGTALSVTAGADTEDGQLAQAVIDAFDYATAKEILEV